MNAIIFLNTTESGTCREILKTAKKLGYKVILFTDNKKQLHERERYYEVDELIYFDYLEFTSLRSYIDEYIDGKYNIISILSFYDNYVSLASRLTDEYTLNTLNSRAVEIMEDKLETRTTFKNEPFTPKFSMFNTDGELKYPLMYKEIHSTGSKGVQIIKSNDELGFINSQEAYLEEYIKGDQYLIELMVKNGQPLVIAKIEQTVTETEFGTFIVKGYSIDKNFKLNENEESMINKIVSTLNLENIHIHIEYKISNGEVKLIEINPRISGSGMYALLNEALEIDYLETMLKLYLGYDVTVPKIKNCCYAHYFLSNRDGVLSKVTGKNKSLKQSNIKKVYIRPKSGQRIRVSETMGDRYGYIIGVGETALSAKSYTENIAENIKFHLSDDTYFSLI